MIQRFTQEQLNKKFDLIIIGGGINGCGIARDASERGLKVLLLEKEDFGSGCTSASSRLIHGGLRYLEYFEFDLVRESLREREILLKNANHLVKPIELCIPVYEDAKRNKWLIKAGMILYDLLSFDKSSPSHKILSENKFKEYEPFLKQENLKSAAVYYDAQVLFPERICLENILMSKKYGAVVLNHAEVIKITLKSRKINLIDFIDKLNGNRYSVSAKVIVNASGPWVDNLCGLIRKKIDRKIGGTKGSHIIVKKFENGPRHAIYSSAKSDGRPFFIIPWLDYYLIGTTDIPYKGDLDHISADKNEIEYLIDETNRLLLSKRIEKDDVLFTYSGVRPLPCMTEKTPAGITRKHIIFDHAKDEIENFLSIIGGKLTTYRDLSEQVVDQVYRKLNKEKKECKTKSVSFPGNINTPFADLSEKYKLDDDIISNLLLLYGSRIISVLNLVDENPEMGKLLSSYSLDIRAQIYFALKNEMAFTLSDVMLRRTTLAFSERLGEDAISYVSEQIKSYFNLTNEEVSKQLNEYSENVVKLRKI